MEPTKTTNRLHFSDLDPLRFEDICFMLLNARYKSIKLEHTGRTGNDSGIDIKGIIKLSSGKSDTWIIQCKRQKSISGSELKTIVDLVEASGVSYNKLLIIVSCDVSKRNREILEAHCRLMGIVAPELWTATNLETYLYEYPKILKLAFGIDKEKETKKNIQRLNRGLRMKERLLEAIIDHKFIKNPANRNSIINEPSSKFISDEVYIRAVDDTTYGTGASSPEGTFNTSYRTFFHDIYFNGIEFLLNAGIGSFVIMDEDGYWEPVHTSSDPRLKETKYKVIPARMIGRIPYHGIVNFIKDGDEYTSCPHLFCLFDGDDNMPYEEIYYKEDHYKTGGIGWDFDRKMQTVFPSRGSKLNCVK